VVLTSEIARRLGMRQPSRYKYFPSLHGVYDALFARGLERSGAAVRAATEPLPPGAERLRAGARDWVRWAVENPALAQLLCWRVVPGFCSRDRSLPDVHHARVRAAVPDQVHAGDVEGLITKRRARRAQPVGRARIWGISVSRFLL